MPLPPATDGAASSDDEGWMRHALALAEQARALGEVPVGAVLVKDGAILAEGWNRPISTHDPTAHAEIVALREAGARVGNYRLVDTTLYVTLEPCVMCMGAISQARVKRLVYAATDPKRGAVESALRLAEAEFLNHRIETTGGVLGDECGAMLREFFRAKR
ncbi:tRNA adenosine(34) deaminase TadA [Methylomagnum ishizawai]|uniref:tRNA adenosine(34) deaminase TadA n=1 Tax=Methylomagnum ishizawai TaxID=1760988 RepID=UPI001C327044|nr:tRNA adenosine(34) deaminase TadA [Methylomagnum ishizawai]BBL76292.1 tRNA-specific adenosine deaminase [Methylomagnum ishizawai]